VRKEGNENDEGGKKEDGGTLKYERRLNAGGQVEKPGESERKSACVSV